MAHTGPLHIYDDVSIVLGGEAGQGIATTEVILTRVLKLAGFNLFSTQEYMSRIRGGSNSNQIRVSSRPVSCPVERIDICIPLDADALPHLASRFTEDTIILGDKERLKSDREMIDVPLNKIATEVGNAIYANTVAAGLIVGLLGIDEQILDGYLREYWADRAADVQEKNVTAARRGYDIARDLTERGVITIEIIPYPSVRNDLLMTGGEAVGLGAIAGGCNFIAAYPMSPSTPVFQFLARHGPAFDIIVEQAEDEIAAMNMAVGAWYAGARALANTAGGGFALMVEALSVAAMLETGVVVHVGQRPGPATGLPTRTEQGDLLFLLFAGHGEFPRAILTPGSLEQAFDLTRRAFNLADRTQSPVFVLTDATLLDSSYNTAPFDLGSFKVEKYFVKTQEDYVRYEITDNGVSPRGVPGFGDGLVVVDSDEHYPDGHITEDFEMRTEMVRKRLRKGRILESEVVPPTFEGEADYANLVVCWGSNLHVVEEALRVIDCPDWALLHFPQVWPLPAGTLEFLQRAENTFIIENNATCQFGRIIKMVTGFEIPNRILKYDGMPFTVEEIVDHLEAMA